MPSLAGDDLDPALFKSTDESTIYPIMYDSLLSFDPKSGDLAPGLATKWEVGADNVISFTLRDAKFSDGKPVTANDVKFSLERYNGLLDPKMVGAGGARLKVEIGAITVQDDKHLTIKSNADPQATLSDLSPNGGIAPYIVPQAVVTALGNAGFNKTPIGSGPYKLASQSKGQSITFERNPTYWGPKPNNAKVTLTFVSDTSTRLSMLSSDQADIVGGICGPSLKQAQGLSNVKITSTPHSYISFISLEGKMNPASPFSKQDVRMAMNMAIDRKSIVDKLMYGKGEPTSLMIFPKSLGYPSNAESLAYKYDVNKAKSLLAGAGYPDGFTFPLYVSTNAQDLGQALQQELAKINVKVDLRVVDQAQTLSVLGDPAGKSQTQGSMIFGYDGIAYRRDYAGALASHLIPNVTAVAQPTGDAEFEALYAKILGDANHETRGQEISQWFTMLNQKAFTVPLWYGNANYAVSSKVKDWQTIPGSPFPFNLQSAKVTS